MVHVLEFGDVLRCWADGEYEVSYQTLDLHMLEPIR